MSASGRSTASPVSIVYVTHRAAPQFDWFADSLAAQLTGDDLEVIFVDGLHSPERRALIESAVADRFQFAHVAPKPSPYNGRHRLTTADYHTPASARNTGIVYARNPYIAFVDDCSVLMPKWWAEVRSAADAEWVIAGAYFSRREMVVADGILVTSQPASNRPRTQDSDGRWRIGRDDAVAPMSGSLLWGGNFAAPRALLLETGGHDELCDPVGGQDYHLGIRLEWAGAAIVYSRRMLMIKSAERHDPGRTIVQRINPILDEPSYMRKLEEFGVLQRHSDGTRDGVHLILDILHGTRAIQPLGNYYELHALDERNLLSTIEHFPRCYWVDGQPLAEM